MHPQLLDEMVRARRAELLSEAGLCSRAPVPRSRAAIPIRPLLWVLRRVDPAAAGSRVSEGQTPIFSA